MKPPLDRTIVPAANGSPPAGVFDGRRAGSVRALLHRRLPIRPLLLLVVLPNLVLSVVSAAMHGERALVNLDYAGVGMLGAFMSAAPLSMLLGVALAADLTSTFAPVFHFGPVEVIRAVEEIRHFGGRAWLFVLALLSIVALCAVALVRLRGPRTPRADRVALVALCGTFALVTVGADVLNGSNDVLWRPRFVLPVDVAGSVIGTQLIAEIFAPSQRSVVIPASTDALREMLAADSGWHGPAKIVLVVVESMGIPRGGSPKALFAPLLRDSILRHFTIRTGAVPFFGATTGGELRALCGRRMNHFTALQTPLENCLPNQLRARGFSTVALHGYNGWLFERRRWYRRVGFERTVFLKDLEARGLPNCGLMFHGTCDSAFTPILREELTRDPARRQLVYWMTLTSHFPIDARSVRPAFSCGPLGRAGEDEVVCSTWRTLWPVMRQIAELATDPRVPPAWYIIVGDHAPPALFSDPRMYVRQRVPFIELRPRTPAKQARDSS